MDERDELERRLAALQRLENPISLGAGVILAALYWIVRFQAGVLVIYSWMIPFFIGSAIPKFIFASLETKLVRELRAIDQPELPAARVVETTPRLPAPPPLAPTVAPQQPEPLAPGEGPRLLK